MLRLMNSKVCQDRTSEHIEVLLKSIEDEVCKVAWRQGLSVWPVPSPCVATLLSPGSRHHGRFRGLGQAFLPSLLSLLVRGITHA